MLKNKNTRAGLITALAILLAGGSSLAQTQEPLATVLPFDAIPSIDAPQFVDRRVADTMYRPDEPVIGLALGHEARAYSTWHLDHHEIVNDTVAGKPIAVTW